VYRVSCPADFVLGILGLRERSAYHEFIYYTAYANQLLWPCYCTALFFFFYPNAVVDPQSWQNFNCNRGDQMALLGLITDNGGNVRLLNMLSVIVSDCWQTAQFY
jgi:hypothetical protein